MTKIRAKMDADARKEQQRFVAETEEAIRSYALQGFADLSADANKVDGYGAPVASGRLAASMRLGVGQVDTTFSPADTGYKYPPGKGPRPLPPRTLANQTIASVSLKLRAFKLGLPIYISNSVPYIRRIEVGGHSWQTPEGVFGPTIRHLERTFKAALKRYARG